VHIHSDCLQVSIGHQRPTQKLRHGYSRTIDARKKQQHTQRQRREDRHHATAAPTSSSCRWVLKGWCQCQCQCQCHRPSAATGHTCTKHHTETAKPTHTCTCMHAPVRAVWRLAQPHTGATSVSPAMQQRTQVVTHVSPVTHPKHVHRDEKTKQKNRHGGAPRHHN
jgi:hypothetical protein